jgi:hypothetical protein
VLQWLRSLRSPSGSVAGACTGRKVERAEKGDRETLMISLDCLSVRVWMVLPPLGGMKVAYPVDQSAATENTTHGGGSLARRGQSGGNSDRCLVAEVAFAWRVSFFAYFPMF